MRGRGLLVGAVVDSPAGEVVTACRELGLLVLTAGEDVVRLAPPLTIDLWDVEEALEILGSALDQVRRDGAVQVVASLHIVLRFCIL